MQCRVLSVLTPILMPTAPLLAAFLHWFLPPSLGLLFSQAVTDLHSPAHSTLWVHSPFLSLSASVLCLLFHFFLALTYLFWLFLALALAPLLSVSCSISDSWGCLSWGPQSGIFGQSACLNTNAQRFTLTKSSIFVVTETLFTTWLETFLMKNWWLKQNKN